MKIRIDSFEGMEFQLLPEFDKSPTLIDSFLSAQLSFLEKQEDGLLVCRNLTMEMIIPIASVLEEKERKLFLKMWETWIFPVVAGDDNKINQLALLHRLKTTKFMFAQKPGEEDGKTYLLKRFITHFEMMRDITMRFEVDGMFIKFPFPLPEIEKARVLALIEEDKEFGAIVKESSPKLFEDMMKGRD